MRVKQIFFLLLMISFLPITAFGADIETEGVDVLNRYLSALTRGDTDEAKSLMGGAFLRKRQRLLNNPEYRQHLVKKYNNAHFAIVKVQHLDNNRIKVSVLTELDNGDNFTFVYTIVRDRDQFIRIIAESRPQQG